MLSVLPALGTWQAAAGAVDVVCRQMQKDGQANTGLSGTQAGMRQCYWQSTGDKLHSLGRNTNLPVVERSSVLVVLLQKRWAEGWQEDGLPGGLKGLNQPRGPALLHFLLVVTSEHVEGELT